MQDWKKTFSLREMANSFLEYYRFNTEIAPDCTVLMRIEKKNGESFQEYGPLEERYHLRDCVQDFIDNKLIQFDNVAALNIITNPLPPHKEGNVNAAIIIVEERISDFSSPSFLWKAMLRALVQESHLDLKGIRTLGFD